MKKSFIIRWVLGILLIFGGIANISSEFLPRLMCIIMGSMITPKFNKLIEKKISFPFWAKMKIPVFVLCFLMFSLTTKNANKKNENNSINTNQPCEEVISKVPSKTIEIEIPKEVKFNISELENNKIPGIKRVVDVRLNRPVSIENLRIIAHKIKNLDTSHYEMTFIFYQLPGMDENDGAWATTHFEPNLEVKILGPSENEYKVLFNQTQLEKGAIIGSWLYYCFDLTRKITIFRIEGKVFMQLTFTDGNSNTCEITEKKISKGYKFEGKKGVSCIMVNADSGDYLLLNNDGNLEIRDSQGLISTARHISEYQFF